MLEVEGVSVSYGRIRALRDVSVSVREGEVVALIGSNGAGKTTLLKTVAGALRPGSGSIRFQGERIEGRAPEAIVRKGVALVQEGRAILKHLTVRENLLLGAWVRGRAPDVPQDLERMRERFPRLRERFGQRAGTLSGGEQQMLAIGRALMARPTLLLLDEPSLGLAPMMTAAIFEIVRDLRASGVTVLLVEQNANQALRIADRAYVLETGSIVLEGADLLEDERVREAYLGT